MDKFLVNFKDNMSMSRKAVDRLYTISVMLRQQECWEFESAIRNISTLRFRELDFKMQHFAKLETYQRLYCMVKCVCVWGGVLLLGAEQEVHKDGSRKLNKTQ